MLCSSYNDVHCVEIDTGKGASVRATKHVEWGVLSVEIKNTEYSFAL